MDHEEAHSRELNLFAWHTYVLSLCLTHTHAHPAALAPAACGLSVCMSGLLLSGHYSQTYAAIQPSRLPQAPTQHSALTLAQSVGNRAQAASVRKEVTTRVHFARACACASCAVSCSPLESAAHYQRLTVG